MKDIERLLCDAVRSNLEKGGKPKVPAGGELLWRWFGDLCSTRLSIGFGWSPLSFAEIDAYRRLTGWPIAERHVRILMSMDDVFRRHEGAAQAPPSPSLSPLTAKGFDAFFG